MNPPSWPMVLQAVLRRERRTLLQFIGEAYPWTGPEDEVRLTQLRALIDEEQQATGRLSAFLQRRRIEVLHPGSFPFAWMNLSFVSLDFLLPHLIEQQRKDIAQLEQDFVKVGDDDARLQLAQLLEMKRRHQQVLEQLAAPRAAAHAC